MHTAVIVHGHHLDTSDWEAIEWGDPRRGKLGNIPKGLVEALERDAATIVFGTAASMRGSLTEGDYALKIAKERIREIDAFSRIEDADAWLDARVVIERTSTDTASEILAGARIALARGADTIVHIACRTHLPRAHATALRIIAAHDDVRPLLSHWYAIASDTSYEGADVDTVVVIEPPHRPDRPKVFFNTTLQPLAKYMNHDLAPELNVALQKVFDEFSKRL